MSYHGLYRKRAAQRANKKKSDLHERLLDHVESRVNEWGCVRFVQRDVSYSVGQLDLRLHLNKGYRRGSRVYVEAKTRYSPKTFRHAREQIRRAIDHDQCDWGIYVAGKKDGSLFVRRVYSL